MASELENLRENTRQLVIATLAACKNGVAVTKFQDMYINDHLTPLPHEKFGFHTIEKYLQSIPETVKLYYRHGQRYVEMVEIYQLADLRSLVKRTDEREKPGSSHMNRSRTNNDAHHHYQSTHSAAAHLHNRSSQSQFQQSTMHSNDRRPQRHANYASPTFSGYAHRPIPLKEALLHQNASFNHFPHQYDYLAYDDDLPRSNDSETDLDVSSYSDDTIPVLDKKALLDLLRNLVPCELSHLVQEVKNFYNLDISDLSALNAVFEVNANTKVACIKKGTDGEFKALPENGRIMISANADSGDSSSSKSGQMKPIDNRPANYKTKLCTRFENDGSCYLRENCTFAHGEHELRSYQTNISNKQNKKEQKIHFKNNASTATGHSLTGVLISPTAHENNEVTQERKSKSTSKSKEKSTNNIPAYVEHLVGVMELLNISLWSMDVPKMLEGQFSSFHADSFTVYDRKLLDFIQILVDSSNSRIRIIYKNNLAFLTLSTTEKRYACFNPPIPPAD